MTPVLWSANLGLLFAEHPLLDRPAAAVTCGFGTIECWWPPDDQARALTERIRALPVDVACINAGCASADAHGACLNDPEHRDTAQRDFRAAVELARAVGARRINLPIGHLMEGRSVQGQLREATAAVRELAEIAAAAAMTILIEPLNAADAPGYLIADADAAAEFIEGVGSDAVRMLFDAYHCARSGGDPIANVYRHVDLIDHVQYADSPGRGRPGSGRSDVWTLVDALAAVGYDGAVGLEYRSHGWSADSLLFIVEAPTSAPIAHGRISERQELAS